MYLYLYIIYALVCYINYLYCHYINMYFILLKMLFKMTLLDAKYIRVQLRL